MAVEVIVGDISDMIIDGEMCGECGEIFMDESTGYPRSCCGSGRRKKRKKKKKILACVEEVAPKVEVVQKPPSRNPLLILSAFTISMACSLASYCANKIKLTRM